MMLRTLARPAVHWVREKVLARRRIRARHLAHVLVLAIHNVVPDDAPLIGERTVHMPLSVFRRLIEWLLPSFDPVPLGELVANGQARRPRFAVTFDDAYRGTVSLALPELVRLGVPATVFVPSGFVGDRDFWWDALAGPETGLDPDTREYVLNELAGDDAAAREWARRSGRSITSMPPFWRTASLDELRHAASLPGISLGCHTVSHPALDRLPLEALQRELVEPPLWFEAHGLRFERTLAYPYGYSSELVQAQAGKAGYESAWLADGGWMHPQSDPMPARPRLAIRGDASFRATVLRIAEF